MASDDIGDQYFTYDGRLASFQTKKKRGSTATGRGNKALHWPHKRIAPESLAHAGFFFAPTPDNVDNVVCFLCQKNMDGWEDGDNPLHEHLKHSSQCGWAIVAAIETDMEGFVGEDPAHPDMVAARKATFAGRWPHEGKRGWKCKTKQLVDAGWKYTPTSDSDDMATCTYCQLALDGWEPGDKPLDEHRKRSPNCAFFALVEQFKGTKKTSRSKAARGSKASRLSTQSVATVSSEVPSMADTTAAGQDDTVMTSASTVTAGGGKKSRAKKATTTKGRKTKAKKDETMEILEDTQPVPDAQPPTMQEMSPVAPPTKAKRGKKRASNAIEESTLTLSQAPAPKKRATKAGGSATVDSSVVQSEEVEMSEAPASKKAPSKKKTRASNTRKVSAKRSVTPSAIMSPPPGHFPDDDEIERQLEAELENSLSDHENFVDDGHEKEDSVIRTWGDEPDRQPEHSPEPPRTSADFAMFNPAPAEVNEEEVEDELEALRAEMEVKGPQVVTEQELEPEPEPEPEPEHELQPEPQVEPEPEPEPELEPAKIRVPKGTSKTGTRKVSKQSKAKKVAPPAPVVEETEEAEDKIQPTERVAEASDDQDANMNSNDTVDKSSQSLPAVPPKRGRGRPSKASRNSFESIQDELADVPTEPYKKPARGRPPKAATRVERPAPEPVEASSQQPSSPRPVKEAAEEPKKRGRGRPSKASMANNAAEERKASPEIREPAKRGPGRPSKKSEVRNTTDPGVQLLAEAEAAAMRQVDEEDDGMELLDAPDSVDDEVASSERYHEQGSEAVPSASGRLLEAPSTPGHGPSPSASARQANLSPSQSPQSSDAENQPPSSVPAASIKAKRVALAPMAATPTTRGSPSKRNVIAGLKSQTPWKKVDLDAVMGTPAPGALDKENSGPDRFLRRGKDLTSPEKRMTVEEWIYFNASEAEKLLKHECEVMVSRFENEGTKAMSVLEGLEVDE